VTSGAWPWNAVLIGAVAVALGLGSFVLTASADAVLIAFLERRSLRRADVGRLVAVNLVAALPAAGAVAVVLIAAVAIAPGEFNTPDPVGGPVLSTLNRLAPYLALFGLTVTAGMALAAVGGRLAVRHPSPGVARAMRLAPAVAVNAAPMTHAAAALVTQLVFIGLTTMLLSVLWAPIGARLTGGGEIDVAIGLLLVGFVAIWLCLVLAGGALHAWSAATWSRLITMD
ncbi:MAG: hypothetical protein ACR2GO_04785, partial [Candidatus Limnocylindria bacterium]